PELESRVEDLDSGFYQRWPDQENLAPMARWMRSSIGLSTDVPGLGGWKLLVEIPIGSQQKSLYNQYFRLLGMLYLLIIVLLAVSQALAARITRPLVKLSQRTTNLPD